MHLSTESNILPPGTKTYNKGGIFFLESKTGDTDQQDSVATSEISSYHQPLMLTSLLCILSTVVEFHERVKCMCSASYISY